MNITRRQFLKGAAGVSAVIATGIGTSEAVKRIMLPSNPYVIKHTESLDIQIGRDDYKKLHIYLIYYPKGKKNTSYEEEVNLIPGDWVEFRGKIETAGLDKYQGSDILYISVGYPGDTDVNPWYPFDSFYFESNLEDKFKEGENISIYSQVEETQIQYNEGVWVKGEMVNIGRKEISENQRLLNISDTDRQASFYSRLAGISTAGGLALILGAFFKRRKKPETQAKTTLTN